jgi:4-amino-4-deoxy-L-arabinose transferase-like glycosyltransferase
MSGLDSVVPAESGRISASPEEAHTGQTSPVTRSLWLAALLPLATLLAATFYLRWQYILRVGLHVDEFSSLWAVRRVLDHGLPLLPSGVIYTRGLFHTYLTALFTQIGGFSFTVGRLPSLFFALATVTLIYWIGWKQWRLSVGVLAALGLALLPEAIEAGGRARFYAPVMFWSLLAAWAFFAAIRLSDGADQRRVRRWHFLFAASFALAIFSHEEIALLYPALLLAALLWRGWGYLRLPGAILAHVISVGAVALRLLIEQIGQPGQLLAIQSSQPYLDLYFDPAGLWRLSAALFLEPARLPWTIGALAAILVALTRLQRRRWRLCDLAPSDQATIFFALLFGVVFALFATLVGASWRNPRYLLFIQSYWLLLGAAGLVQIIALLIRRPRGQAVAVGAVALLLVILMQDDALSTTRERMLGYEHAFAYVAAQRQPGDIVMTPQAAGCALVMGAPCDYYTQGRDFEPFVLVAGDRLIDRWSGATLLATLPQLETVLARGRPVWFVTDGERLLKRFEDGFARAVLERFEVVRADDSARVLHFTGTPPLPATAWLESFAPVVFTDWLTLTRLAHSAATPGGELIVRTDWRVAEDQDAPTISVQLVSEDGARPASTDGVLADGVINPGQAEGVPIPDTKVLHLPADLPDGLHRLEIVAYSPESGALFAEPIPVAWFWVGAPPAAPSTPIAARWRNGIELTGAGNLPDALRGADTITLPLRWQGAAPLTEEFTAFVHLVGPDGAIVAQDDHAPRHGFWPTTGWRPGAAVDDAFTLTLPATLASGDYRLLTGWYSSATGERVLLDDGRDALELARWTAP